MLSQSQIQKVTKHSLLRVRLRNVCLLNSQHNCHGLDMSSHAHAADSWDSHAGTWTNSVQEITLAPCQELIHRVISSSMSDATEFFFLDNGCGAGMVTSLLKSKFPAVPITATDVSTGMLESTRERAKEERWDATFHQSNAENLVELNSNSFSHVFSTFVISFTDLPSKAIGEMYRVLSPNGIVGIATWSDISWVPIWQEAARAVKGDAYVAPTLFHPDTMDSKSLEQDMIQAGFTNVNVTTFKCYHPPKAVDSAVNEFYSMGNPSTKLLMQDFSSDEVEQTKKFFKDIYNRIYDGGKQRQFELALLVTGQKLGS